MKTTLLIAAVVLLSGFIFRGDLEKLLRPASKIENKQKKEKSSGRGEVFPELFIRQQWNLPGILREVSGIAYMAPNQFACVQDETGTIYVYNTASNKIEKEIAFAGSGDFEGLALKGNIAYVVRADGLLYEVDMPSGKTREHQIGSEYMRNIESLGYDRKSNRLLLAGKDEDPALPGFKGIYAFDLASNVLMKDPAIKIALENGKADVKGKNKGLKPSALAVHPLTNELYIIDGPKAKLMVADAGGNIKHLYDLGGKFAQPEGISFTPTGELYISNEGKKGAANIIAVGIE